MGPTQHLDSQDEGEEEDKASSEVGEGALSGPSAVGSSEEALVSNMMRLNIEREDVKDDNEDDEDEECQLQTLTIQGRSDSPLSSDCGHYTPKGPIRKGRTANDTCPYAGADRHQEQNLRPNNLNGEDSGPLVATNGLFLDEICAELNLNGSRSGSGDLSPTSAAEVASCGIPDLPREAKWQKVNRVLMSSLDDAFGKNQASGVDTSMAGSRIILCNPADRRGFSILSTPMKVVLEEKGGHLGIEIPRQGIPSSAMALATSEGKLDINLQLDAKMSRVTKVSARVDPAAGVICAQTVRLQVFQGNPLRPAAALLVGVAEEQLQNAATYMGSRTVQEILKTYGPNEDTMLNVFCDKKIYTQNMADIFQLTRRILSSPDPNVRRNITQKNGVGISALEKAAMNNKPVVADFLAEVFCTLGEDVLCQGQLGNTLIHALARKGDNVASVLESLLDLRYNEDGTSGRSVSTSEDGRVYNTDNLINSKSETPLHMAAIKSVCHSATINILHRNFPSHASRAAEDGLPLHYACQLSHDPQTVTALIGCNPRLVNSARRSDGLTPLHLVASRSNLSIAVAKIEALDESAQIAMVRILLDAGANRSAVAQLEGKALLPVDLCDGRPAVKRLLEVVSDTNTNGLSIQSPPESSTSGSHSPAGALGLSPGTLGLSPSPPSVTSPNNLALIEAASMFESGLVMMPTPSSVGSSSSRGLYDSSSSPDLSDDNNIEETDVIAQVLEQHPAISAALDDALGAFEVSYH